MQIEPSRVLEALKVVRDPDLNRDIVSLGIIKDLTIDGEVEGTIEMQEHRLTVGLNGRVRASVKAREVIVLGTLHGNVETGDRIDIRKEAKLVGDIRTARRRVARAPPCVRASRSPGSRPSWSSRAGSS